MTAFENSLLVLGVLLVGGALISGIAHRSILSLAAVFVLAGFGLGDGGLKLIHFDAQSGFVTGLTTIALIVILFRDGLEVEQEMLQRAWHVPLRSLLVAMPVTAVLVAVAAAALTDLTWTQSFLLGALLSPTDPVLSSSVVTNPRVPRLVRHSLNLESGLNDGLALPGILVFAMALDQNADHFVWWKFVAQDVSIGLLAGLLVGLVGAALLPRTERLEREILPPSKALYALGVGLVAYAVAVAPPHGNGFIAVFVCGIVLGLRRADLREFYQQRSDELNELVKLAAFVVFGSLLTLEGLFQHGWTSVAFAALVLVAVRPLALIPALAGTGLDGRTKAFMAWFGPKGVATMAFSLLVLGMTVEGGQQVFNLTSLVVFSSILAHGLSDTPGANWLAGHSKGRARSQ